MRFDTNGFSGCRYCFFHNRILHGGPSPIAADHEIYKEFNTCNGRQGIGDDRSIILHQPFSEKFIWNRKMNLVPLQGCYLNGHYPGVKVLLADLIFNNIDAFVPENIQFHIPL